MLGERAHLRVAVLGASGYAGGELVRLLLAHPNVEIAHLAANESAGRALAEIHPHLATSPVGGRVLASLEAASAADEASFAFLSLPHGASVSSVVRVRASGAGLAGEGGLRTARGLRRPNRRGIARGQPGLLPDAGRPRPRSAPCGRTDRARAGRRGRQDRAVRRGESACRGHLVCDDRGERSPLPLPHAPAHARDGASPRARLRHPCRHLVRPPPRPLRSWRAGDLLRTSGVRVDHGVADRLPRVRVRERAVRAGPSSGGDGRHQADPGRPSWPARSTTL